MRTAVRALRDAWERRDAAALARSLTHDATLIVDHGGLVTVPVERAEGADAVASALIALFEALPADALVEADVNGSPGLVLRAADRAVGVVGVDVRRRAVSHLWAVRNPEKLERWNA